MTFFEQLSTGVSAAIGSPVILYLLLTAGLVGVATHDALKGREWIRAALRMVNGLVLGLVVSMYAPNSLVIIVVSLATLSSLLVAIHIPLRKPWGRAMLMHVPALFAGLVVGLMFQGHDVSTTPLGVLIGVMATVFIIITLVTGVLALARRLLLLSASAFVIAQRVLGAWMVAIGAMSLTFIVMQ